jgi:hypothetical protein
MIMELKREREKRPGPLEKEICADAKRYVTSMAV